jgi:hypothetical protein
LSSMTQIVCLLNDERRRCRVISMIISIELLRHVCNNATWEFTFHRVEHQVNRSHSADRAFDAFCAKYGPLHNRVDRG